MTRMDQQQAVKQVEWLAEIRTQIGEIERASKRIDTARAQIVRLKGVVKGKGATADDLGTYDHFLAQAKATIQAELDKF